MNKKFEYIDDNPGSYFGMLVESVKDKKELEEDKFVSKDKMSKKAQKELNDKKRGTWGSTKPVTRVQPNKKTYDRKRDSKVVDESKELNEIRDFEWNRTLWTVVKDDGSFAGSPCLSWEEARELSAQHEGSKIFEMKLDRDQINESKKLNESSDGWDESKLYDLSEILDEIYNLQYEVQNTVRGAYTNAHTYEELGYYVHNLGSNLMDIGDEIMEMEEEDEEDED